MNIKKIFKALLLVIISIILLVAVIIAFRLLIIKHDFDRNRPTDEMYFEGKIYGNYFDILEAGNYWVSFFDIDGNRTRHEEIDENIFNQFYITFIDGEVYAQVVVTPSGEMSGDSNIWKIRQLYPLLVNIHEVNGQQVKYILNIYYREE